VSIPRDSRIFVAGGRTMIGAALRRRLEAEGFQLFAVEDEPDHRDPQAVDRFFGQAQPACVFVAAGETAGIAGNSARPADLMTDNLLVAANLIPAAVRHGVSRLLYLASSCIYPKGAPQPLRPESLWSGALEPTSAAYATAKLAGLMLSDAFNRQHGVRFITAIGGDAYGPGDDFRPEHSHVAAALVQRFDEAARTAAPFVTVWGTGTPRRELIYVDDLADACVFAMDRYDNPAPINLGSGADTSIADLAREIADVVGYRGEIRFDPARPDGMPYKGLDSTALRSLGWRPAWTLRRGLEETYRWYTQAER
jgi:GDP-L-fucose synthase